jgi:Fe-Mn family superoxide dismutase
MDRKSFLKGSILTTGSIILAGANGVYAQNIEENGIDKLTDEKGNFIHQPLPYSQCFLDHTWMQRHCNCITNFITAEQ